MLYCFVSLFQPYLLECDIVVLKLNDQKLSIVYINYIRAIVILIPEHEATQVSTLLSLHADKGWQNYQEIVWRGNKCLNLSWL